MKENIWQKWELINHKSRFKERLVNVSCNYNLRWNANTWLSRNWSYSFLSWFKQISAVKQQFGLSYSCLTNKIRFKITLNVNQIWEFIISINLICNYSDWTDEPSKISFLKNHGGDSRRNPFGRSSPRTAAECMKFIASSLRALPHIHNIRIRSTRKT
jgi:hypothetical protein